MSGPTIKRATKRASKIAVIDGLMCLRISHSRIGHVAKARTPAHASAGKKRRKIQIAAKTKIVRSTTRPINCRDDCCIKNAASILLHSRRASSKKIDSSHHITGIHADLTPGRWRFPKLHGRAASSGSTFAPPAICGLDGSKRWRSSRLETIARARRKASFRFFVRRSAILKNASPK